MQADAADGQQRLRPVGKLSVEAPGPTLSPEGERTLASLVRRGLSLPLGGFPPPRETGAVGGGGLATHKSPRERLRMMLGTRSEPTAAAAVCTEPP